MKGIPRDRRWLLFLTVVNLGGFVYGMDWYRGQLASLPVWTWPVVADCPVSALLFGCLTGALALGVAPGALEGLADVAALKYGMWTVLVIGQSWLAGGSMDVDRFNLLWTHAGMVAESLLFGVVRRPPLRWVAVGAAWVALNSLLDYGCGLHPTLPDQTPVSLALAASVGLGLLAVGFFAALAVKRRGGLVPWRRDGFWG